MRFNPAIELMSFPGLSHRPLRLAGASNAVVTIYTPTMHDEQLVELASVQYGVQNAFSVTIWVRSALVQPCVKLTAVSGPKQSSITSATRGIDSAQIVALVIFSVTNWS